MANFGLFRSFSEKLFEGELPVNLGLIGSFSAQYIIATGGTVVTDGDYKIHTFTSSGTFTVTSPGSGAQLLVVAGGGGGGSYIGGGGGAGGLLYSANKSFNAQSYTVTIGAGGVGSTRTVQGTNGNNSIFDDFTAVGGGCGSAEGIAARNGGSGGGGGGFTQPAGTGTSGQGFGGGTANNTNAGGGGGASAVGQSSTGSSIKGGNGGDGLAYAISGSSVYYAGGGGGAGNPGGSLGGLGGGGNGSDSNDLGSTNATQNTGGGGGAAWLNQAKSGGSGIVIIRYKFQ
jgi:hypothetical protein